MQTKGTIFGSRINVTLIASGKLFYSNKFTSKGLWINQSPLTCFWALVVVISTKKYAMVNRRTLLGILASLPLAFMANAKSILTPPLTKGFKVGAGEARFGTHYKMKGVTLNILDIKISGIDTHGALAVFEQTGMTPHGGPPLHIHPNQDEWFYVVEGQYTFKVGEDTHELKQGDTIFLPRQVPHAFIQRTEKAKVIVSYLPAGKMESFFKTTNEWASPPSQDEIVKVFADHDMKVVGPPIKLG